jgi:acyl-CoA thioester hydrolase
MSDYIPYEHRVFYYETDGMGVVHHSNYFRWYEEARLDFMDQMGYTYEQAERDGLLIPVLSARCDYKSAAVFGDVIIVVPKIEFFNGFKMTVTYRLFKKDPPLLSAVGETRHCFTDLKLSPVRIKREHPLIYELFNNCAGVDFLAEQP